MELLVCRQRIPLEGRPETTEERATSVTGSSAFYIQETDCRGRKWGKSGSRGLVHAAVQMASGDAHEAHGNAAQRRENLLWKFYMLLFPS